MRGGYCIRRAHPFLLPETAYPVPAFNKLPHPYVGYGGRRALLCIPTRRLYSASAYGGMWLELVLVCGGYGCRGAAFRRL